MTDKSTTPQSKLEECARAAFDRHKYKYPERWEDLIPNIRESYIDDTRAVIRCLMNPNERMLEASWKTTANRTREEYMEMELATDKMAGHKKKAIQRFRAMLQSVLDEAQE